MVEVGGCFAGILGLVGIIGCMGFLIIGELGGVILEIDEMMLIFHPYISQFYSYYYHSYKYKTP